MDLNEEVGMAIQKELKRRFLEAAGLRTPYQVRKRHSRLSELDSRFGLLCRPTELFQEETQKQEKVAQQFAEHYPNIRRRAGSRDP